MPSYRPSNRRGKTGNDAHRPEKRRHACQWIVPHGQRDEKSPTEHKITDMKRRARKTPKIG